MAILDDNVNKEELTDEEAVTAELDRLDLLDDTDFEKEVNTPNVDTSDSASEPDTANTDEPDTDEPDADNTDNTDELADDKKDDQTKDNLGDIDNSEEVGNEDSKLEDTANKTDTGEKETPVDLKSLLAPLPYKGTEVAIGSIEDLRILASKGLDYQNKTTEIANDRRFIDTLKDNGLLNENTINELIALHNIDPVAVAKFIADSEDILSEVEVTDEQIDNYQPKQEVSSQEAHDIKNVLTELEGQDKYQEMVSEIDANWDTESQTAIAKNPDILRHIRAQMEIGVYTTVANKVTLLRSTGKIPANTSFLDAYQQVGLLMEQDIFANQKKKTEAVGNTGGSNNTDENTSITQGNNPLANSKPSKDTRTKKSLSLDDLDDLDDEAFLKRFGGI